MLLLGIKTKILLSESIFKSSQCQVALKKVNKNSYCGKTSFHSISYQQLRSINQSETQVAYAGKVSSNPNFYYCYFYYEDKSSYYHLKQEGCLMISLTDAGRSTHREEKRCMRRPVFLPSWTTPPFQFWLLHSSLHLFAFSQ